MREFQKTIHDLIWNPQIEGQGPWKRRLLAYTRIIAVIIRELGNGHISLHAMGLVYTTQLSLVPLLAVSFFVFKGLGVHNRIQPALLNMLEPLGPVSATITNQVIIFVENAQLGVLGSLGFLMLLYSVISLLNKVEAGFNLIWHVRQGRPFTRRFSDFLSVLVVGSLLLITAVSVSTASMNSEIAHWLFSSESLGLLSNTATRLLPFLLSLATFTLLYAFIPNTQVRFFAALSGGIAATVLWKISGWIIAIFVTNSPNLTAIYSTFVGTVLFMIWLYVSWVITLIGASIAFYSQYPEYLTDTSHNLKLSNRMKEHLSLLALYWIGQNHYQRKPAWTIPTLAEKIEISANHMTEIVMALKDAGLLTQSNHLPPHFPPSCPFETTTINEVLRSVRRADESQFISPSSLRSEPTTEQLMTDLDEATKRALKKLTIKEFVLAEPPKNKTQQT